MSTPANLPPENHEREWLEIWQMLVDCGVPHAVASDALQLLAGGGSVRQAFDMCEAAMPAVDVPLLRAAQTLVDEATAASLRLRRAPAYAIPPERAEGEE